MKLSKNTRRVLLWSAVLLAGCAYKVPYNSVVAFPERGNQKIAVAAVDERPDVLRHDNPPNFIGLMRSGFGIPQNGHTDDGRPLAEDFSSSVAISLSDNGYQAAALPTQPADSDSEALKQLQQTGASRLVLLEIRRWSSDTYVNPSIDYDVTLHVFDGSGKELASKSDSAHDRELSGGNMFNPRGASEDVIQEFYEGKLKEWFGDPAIQTALKQ